MKKIVVYFTLFFVIFACKSDGNFNSNPLLFKEYIAGFTSGLISSEMRFRIMLNRDIPSDKIQKINELDLFEISPRVKGKVVSLSPNQVEFIPEKRLEQHTEYKISFHLKKIFNDISEELEQFNFTAKTLPQSYNISALGLQSYSENLYFLNAELIANDVVTDKVAQEIIQASVGGKKIPVKVTSKGSHNRFAIIFDSIPRGNQPEELVVNWKTNDTAQPFSYTIPKKGTLEPVSIHVPEDVQSAFEISFSEPLDKHQIFNGLVTISDVSTEPKFSVNGNILKVYSEEANLVGTREVAVYQGIISVYGKRTEETSTLSVEFFQQKPEVRLVKNGTILPSSENLKINFQTINLRAVNVSVSRIYQNNILQFLQENDLNTSYSLSKVGKVIAKKVIKLENLISSKRWATHSLDLSTLITPEKGAIYRVKFSFIKNYSTFTCSGTLAPLDTSFEEDIDNQEDTSYYEEYYWEQSDDPCSEAYYYGKSVATNVLATDLGVIVKKGQNDTYTVIVNDILTTEPVSGATVQVFDYQQQKIQEQKTNSDGIATFELSSRAFFAKIQKKDNITYVKMDDEAPQSVSKYDADGMRLQKGLNGYIYTERGVWRPGDSIYVGFILNDFAQKTPDKLPIKLRFTDPYGKVIAERMQTRNATNQYVFGLNTSPYAPTGSWNVNVSVGAAKFDKQIKIETIKPNRLKIETNLAGKTISSEGENAHFQVLWLHGSPAGNAPISVQAKFYPMETVFKGYESFLFNNKAYEFENQELDVYEGKTNDAGISTFHFQTKNLQAPGMLRVNFITKVNEAGGDFSTDVSTASFSPYKSYVGLKLPTPNKYDYYETEKNHTFETVVLSEKGNVLPNQNVSVVVYKVDWNWWWDASNQNISSYSSSSRNAIYSTQNITTDANGKARFELNIPDADWGKYFITLQNESGHICGTTLYFDWETWSGKSKKLSSENAVMLSLGSDKKAYNVGEKAKVSFPSDKGGRALISVENGSNVLETFWVETASGETIFDVPITEKMTPNVYFYVTLLQPHASTINDAPIRLYGVLPISVVDKNTVLEPVIQMADVLRPEQKTTIKITEKNRKSMTYTLAIVEDGLLNLTRFKTPNAWNKFFAKTALGVKTWDVYDDIIGAYGGTINQAFSIGGDEDLGGAEAQKANRFKPFVIFEGPFELKKGATNSHTISVPNYMGSVRVMVVASDVAKNAFGSAEKKDVAVYNPVSVLGSLPRKALPNERITLPVTVFAMEKNVKNVSISVQTNELFSVVGDKNQTLNFTSTGEKMAYFELAVANRSGVGKVKIVATANNHKTTYEVEMNVDNPNPVTYLYDNKVVTKGETITLNTTLVGEKNNTTLEISSFAGIDLHRRLNYLISYPHGCAEQVTSGAFPQLFLGEFVNLTKEKSEEVRKNVTLAISKLYENQLTNGGFSYWKGNSYADDWATSYVGHFYIEAEKKGYVLPSGSKQNWIDYQSNQARVWQFDPKTNSDFAQAYRLYTLALAGNANMGAMNRLRETSGISANTKRMLSASYAVAGQVQTARNLFQSVAMDGHGGADYYGSEVRNKAMALEVALLVGKTSEAGRWASEIASTLSSSEWLSTQSTAYSLYAMSKYLKINGKGKEISASYTFNGKTENVKSAEPIFTQSLSVKSDNQLVTVKNNSPQTLYVRLISSGIFPIGKELPIERGVAVSTVYHRSNGEVIDPTNIKQGTEFFASITVKNLTNETVENLALTHLIASGWEIINNRFAEDDVTETSYIDHTDLRDDRANYYFSLGANQSKTIKLKLNASYRGRYYLPSSFVEAMYNHNYQARNEGKWVEVF